MVWMMRKPSVVSNKKSTHRWRTFYKRKHHIRRGIDYHCTAWAYARSMYVCVSDCGCVCGQSGRMGDRQTGME